MIFLYLLLGFGFIKRRELKLRIRNIVTSK